MTLAEIRQTLCPPPSPPSPKLSGKLKTNIYMAGWAFLINRSLLSHSADIHAGFQWPSLSKAQDLKPTLCDLCTCGFVRSTFESIKCTGNENLTANNRLHDNMMCISGTMDASVETWNKNSFPLTHVQREHLQTGRWLRGMARSRMQHVIFTQGFMS